MSNYYGWQWIWSDKKNSSVGVYINPHYKHITLMFYTETYTPIQPKYNIKMSKENSKQLSSILKDLEKYLWVN